MYKAAIVGCGYISYYYGNRIFGKKHPFQVVGCYDINTTRSKKWAEHFKVKHYETYECLLNDEIDLVINLTPPEQHFTVNKTALEAGKHIYCEKPLAMTLEQAKTLLEIAKNNNLHVGAAPCSAITDPIAKLVSLLDTKAIGTVRFVDINMHDMRVDLLRPDKWENPLGVVWPYKNEFEMGCTTEHSAYCLAIATTLFGPVASVDSVGKAVITEKVVNDQETVITDTPDLTVTVLSFASGVIGQMTCSILSNTPSRSIEIHGDEGTIILEDCWNYNSRLILKKKYYKDAQNKLDNLFENLAFENIVFEFNDDIPREDYSYNIDQARGIINLCVALKGESSLLCGNHHAVHITEVTHAITRGGHTEVSSKFTLQKPSDILEAIAKTKCKGDL